MAVKTLQTVKNALAVLEAVAELQPIGVSALARHMKMDKNTAQRILVTLGVSGYIRKFGQGNSWELTPRVLTLSNKVAVDLRKVACNQLQELSISTGETALLWHLSFVEDENTATLLDKFDSTHDVKVTMEIGKKVLIRSATQVTSNIHVMLARYPTGADAWLNRADDDLAPYFLVSPGHPNAVAIGSIIYDGPSLPIASVSVLGPKERISADRYEFIGQKTARAAAAISGI